MEAQALDVEEAEFAVPEDCDGAGTALATAEDRAGVPAPVQALTPGQMLSLAVERGAGMEMIEKLMDLQDRYEAKLARQAFDQAMAAAKAEIPTIRKNRTVDFTSTKGRTHYQHEDLAGIASVVDPILGKHGLSYRYETVQQEGGAVKVTCIISHRDGHYVENSLTAGRDESGNKNNIQSIGSTITYLQRYTLKAALGLAASHDDDGKTAERSGPISDEQLAALRKALDASGGDIRAFCDWQKIDALPDLPADRFDAAMKVIRQKAAKAGEKAQ